MEGSHALLLRLLAIARQEGSIGSSQGGFHEDLPSGGPVGDPGDPREASREVHPTNRKLQSDHRAAFAWRFLGVSECLRDFLGCPGAFWERRLRETRGVGSEAQMQGQPKFLNDDLL